MSAAQALVDLAREALVGAPVIVVGVGPSPVPGLAELGAQVRATISVVPAGGPPAPPSEAPRLWIEGAERDIFAHVVDGFARAIEGAAPAIERLLARVDPRREAAIVSYLPAPRRVFGGRPWRAQDSALSRALEDKAAGVLDGALPQLRYAALRWPCARARWSAIEAELGSTCLVVQALGLAGGGAGTRIVRSYDEATRRVPALGEALRVARYVDGTAGNVMGVVPPSGPILALPASVQLVAEDGSGAPVYAGNRFTAADFSVAEREAIAADVRGFGERLRARGFVGPFGLDFLRDSAGSRRYHDLNPRMNGAAGLIAELAAEALGRGPAPLPGLLLSGRAYSAAQAEATQAAIAELVRARPRWRIFLACVVDAPFALDAPPVAGRWAVEVDPLRLAWRDAELAAPLDPRLAHLRVSAPPGLRLRAGDRLVLGELSVAPALGEALWRAHGAATPERLVRALLAAGAGA
ncbi:MAG: hypothetical protein R3A79_11045 [Nannocystaceae bacterium]